MKAVVDMEDPHYYIQRSIELLTEAKAARVLGKYQEYHYFLNKSIQMIALARMFESDGQA
jgi:hypothetical protein